MTQVVEVSSSKPRDFKKYLPLATILIGIGAAALVLGFGLGKYQTANSDAKKSTNGNTTNLRTENFSIDYPKEWISSEIKKEEGIGAKIVYRGNQVEFWLDGAREHRFTDEQKANQKAQKDSTLTVDGRSAKVSEFAFKGGSYFLVVKLPALEEKASVIFWISASDEEYKKKTVEIVSSYKNL